MSYSTGASSAGSGASGSGAVTETGASPSAVRRRAERVADTVAGGSVR